VCQIFCRVLLKQLHWLSIEWHIKFKIACIIYKTISTTQPAYLYSSLKHYTPSRTFRSSDSKLLFVLRVRTCFGSRSFAVAARTIWNSLPLAIRSSVSTYSFRCQLKTFFYNLAFWPLQCPTRPRASDSAGLSLTLCTLQIYLITYLLINTLTYLRTWLNALARHLVGFKTLIFNT